MANKVWIWLIVGLIAVISFPEAKGDLCPDHRMRCAVNQTCCITLELDYGCCRYGPDATCCDDGDHCCPPNYTCDLINNKCILKPKSGWTIIYDSFANDEVLTSNDIPTGNHDTTELTKKKCPDGDRSCPDAYTCCSLASGGYGCCPFQDGVCCSDQVHCCAKGLTCNTKSGGCD